MTRNFILAAMVAVAGFASDASARLTGTNPTGANSDTVCYGKRSAETCQDYLGDYIPTTTNTQSLGTSSLLWSTLYATAGAFSGAVSVTGNLIKVPVSTQTVTAGGTISVANACGGLLRLSSTQSVTTNTTDTFDAPTTANLGCVLYVVNVGPGGTITLDDNAHFDVPNNVVLGTNDGAIVVQGSTSWILLGTSDN